MVSLCLSFLFYLTFITTWQNVNAITQAECLNLRNHFYSASTSQCFTCPATKRNKVFAIYWESFVGGCDQFLASSASQYVTHVYWTFATIGADGTVGSSLQGNDNTLKSCIQQLRQNCIKSLISIGGPSDRKQFMNLQTSANLVNFQNSLVALINKYTLDGINVVDQSTNFLVGGSWLTYSNTFVMNYVRTIKTAFQQITLQPTESPLLLTWTESVYSGRPISYCDQPNVDFLRCYNDQITPLVDFINVIAYDFGTAAEFDSAITTELPQNWVTRAPSSKLVLGICRGTTSETGSCGFGPTPTTAQQLTYALAGTNNYDGIFLWTGSSDWTATSGSVVKLMGQAGDYAHG